MASKNVEKLTPEVVDMVNRLSRTERAELDRQEKRIAKALPSFQEIGEALSVIREVKLYRESHETFDAYLSDRWGFTRQRASQVIQAAKVMAELPASVRPVVKSERAARAMRPVADKPAKAKRAVKDATKAADGEPSAADLERAVQGVVGDGAGPAPRPSPTPSTDLPGEWLALTDRLHLPSMDEATLRKVRATAAGLVTAVDVALGESRKERHVAAAKKRVAAKRGTTVEPRFKGAGK